MQTDGAPVIPQIEAPSFGSGVSCPGELIWLAVPLSADRSPAGPERMRERKKLVNGFIREGCSLMRPGRGVWTTRWGPPGRRVPCASCGGVGRPGFPPTGLQI